ncbi:hypothetical protein L383_00662 [Enterobacter sp. MGH 37]|nr:hypothetical protein L371_04667 [Enterobacter sp. MGH 25]EUM45093.1 hypothetical protein L383_01994 [Enterobacter sp. MGH 37]EUM48689.1 hypothetical protein L383_00662 [Enterobacter sp. MGH 37]CAE7598922.1 hypothetical protein AI2762V1_1653 [Enterobacter cloacae]CAH3625539.1 hypothetical protein AI2762V1_1653 [Enterobacter cloacae]
MLRRYAITNAVYQPRQCDVVSLSLISNNQPFGYLHLVLRRAASTEIKAQHVVREAGQPVDHQLCKPRNGHRIVFQHDHPARLLSSPFKCSAMVSISSTVALIN